MEVGLQMSVLLNPLSFILQTFCRKLHENERIWTPRGLASLVPSRGPNASITLFQRPPSENTIYLLHWVCTELVYRSPILSLSIAVADPLFPRQGEARGHSKCGVNQPTNLPNFPENRTKMKKKLDRGRGILAPPQRSATALSVSQSWHFWQIQSDHFPSQDKYINCRLYSVLLFDLIN